MSQLREVQSQLFWLDGFPSFEIAGKLRNTNYVVFDIFGLNTSVDMNIPVVFRAGLIVVYDPHPARVFSDRRTRPIAIVG